jgi:seryl-tRNA(Sec) selenium transferase
VSTSDEHRPNDDVQQLRSRATRLFALAIKMREDGHQFYTEELLKLASEALAQAVAMERRLARAVYEARLRSNDSKPGD